MKKIIKTSLFLLAMSPITCFSQTATNSSGNQSNHQSCMSAIISGETNPSPGAVETYTHTFSSHGNNQFIWEVEGAVSIDGQLTDANNEGTITKPGQSVEVVWDDIAPIGKVKVRPVNQCALLAQAGELNKVVVVNKAGVACPAPFTANIANQLGFTDIGNGVSFEKSITGSCPCSLEDTEESFVVNLPKFPWESDRVWSFSGWDIPPGWNGGPFPTNMNVSNDETTATLDYGAAGMKIQCVVYFSGNPCPTTFTWNIDVYQPDIWVLDESCDGVLTIYRTGALLCGILNTYNETLESITPGVIMTEVDDFNYGYAYHVDLNGNTTWNYRIKSGSKQCEGSDWAYGTYTSTQTPVTVNPIQGIDILSSDICAGSIEVSTPADATHESYDWYIDGAFVQNSTSNTVTLPITDPGHSFYIEVEAKRECSTSPLFSKWVEWTLQPSVFNKGFSSPIEYCSGTNNEFVAKNQQTGLEYRWQFIPDGNAEPPASGFGMNTYSPDFGAQTGGPVYPYGSVPGEVSNYTLTLEVRSSCAGGWSPVVSETVNGVNYVNCNPAPETIPSQGGGFSINVNPNPANDLVSVEMSAFGAGQKNIKIVDAFGLTRKNVNSNQNSIDIDISDLEVGNYNVVVTKGSNIDSELLQVTP